MGTSLTMIQHERRMSRSTTERTNNGAGKLGIEVSETESEPQKRAVAGVGSPIKEWLCRVSRLNLASRSAENAAMRNAAYGK